MQILYNNQCQLEPDQSDPVGDLKLDHRGHCWKTDAYKAALDRGMTKTIVPIVVTVPTTPFISTTTSTVPLSVMTSEIVVLSASQTTTEAPVSTSPATATTTTVTANTNTTTATITTTSTTNTAGELKTDSPMLSKSSADSLKPVPANLLSQGKGGQGILMSESLHYSFSDKEISSESAKDISDFKSDSNNTSNAAINQDKPIKETLSIEHLTIGLILLGIVNILLLFCFIMLVLWIRRRTRKNLKHQSSKLREFDKFYQDFTGIDVTGSNGIYETSQYPLLISSISGTYLSESHPKLNVRHNSFPNSSLSRSQNSDTFLPIRNSNNNTSTNSNNYNPDNSNQSQQHLLGRSTSYSSTVWNGSLRNGLNKCSANENTSVLSKMNRIHSKDRWDYPSNGFPAEYNHHTSSTPYSSRQQLQSINSYPYRRDEIKCSSQTFYPPMPSTSSTAAIAAEIIAQKERERKCLYGSRSRLPSEQPSPTQRHEIKRSPTSSYRKHKKRSISSKPPVGVSRKPHTLVFEGDNGSDKNKWPEILKHLYMNCSNILILRLLNV
ncbi:unnamed protein product [Heterobilharzia americana]|nr:unnamed protein product [Heterobilharzia americana]